MGLFGMSTKFVEVTSIFITAASATVDNKRDLLRAGGYLVIYQVREKMLLVLVVIPAIRIHRRRNAYRSE